MGSRADLVWTAALLAIAAVSPAAAQEKAPTGTEAGSATARQDAAPSRQEVEDLKREVERLREQIRLLQDQIAALAKAGPATAPNAIAPTPAAPTPGAAPPPRSQSLLNPAISAVLQTIGNTSLRRTSAANGFDLSEAEIAFQSVVDPYAKVDLFLTFPAGATPEVEEGYATTLSLPGSLQLKGGRFKSALGKWNTLHDHAFFTVDRPDSLVNFLGDESLTNDGLSLSVLVPNPWDLYIDSITEAGTALPGTSFNGDRRNLTWLEHLAFFFNTSPNATFELGLTGVFGKAGVSDILNRDLAAAGLTGTLVPRGELDSEVDGLDLTYKWKPLRLNVYRSFLWQTEVLRSRRDVEDLAPGPALASETVTAYGGYTYLESQFSKRWRAGARYDLSGFPDRAGDRERDAAGVVRFVPSEFQEFRFEMKRTWRNDAAAERFDGERDDTRLFFEWIPVIGAHGAHKY